MARPAATITPRPPRPAPRAFLSALSIPGPCPLCPLDRSPALSSRPSRPPVCALPLDRRCAPSLSTAGARPPSRPPVRALPLDRRCAPSLSTAGVRPPSRPEAHGLSLVISTGGPPCGPQWRDLAANQPCRHAYPTPWTGLWPSQPSRRLAPAACRAPSQPTRGPVIRAQDCHPRELLRTGSAQGTGIQLSRLACRRIGFVFQRHVARKFPITPFHNII
jgi:hypothetical protein